MGVRFLMFEILGIMTLFLLGLPFFIFGLYGIIILYHVRRKKPEKFVNARAFGFRSLVFKPFISILIPTHNEELLISKRITNIMASDYPDEKFEIIFVDDSDDSTPEIIEEYAKTYRNIRLIRLPERMGYSPCMIAGCKAAKGEIIVFGDAGSFIETETISNLVRHFQTPNIGAVTGSSIILNTNEEVGRSEQLYVKIMNFIREGETMMDSTFHFNGEACAVRKELVTDLDWCDATFDTTTALFVRQKGYKTIYDPSVRFYEYAPRTRSERVQQKVIRAANLVKALLRFKHMLFRCKYGKFGCIILPMSMAMLIVSPIAILLGFMFLLAATFTNLTFYSILWSVIGSLFVVALIVSKEMALTFLEFEYSLLKAFYQLVFTKRTYDKIDKVISTRRN
jgi:cellulose synthase/poly-beta-1,6-N-acetylglucosamine synthase-like glycosyltransferase